MRVGTVWSNRPKFAPVKISDRSPDALRFRLELVDTPALLQFSTCEAAEFHQESPQTCKQEL